ncbi:MAG: hypothetical protein OQJ80_03990 [Kangiella sp.]|nr:hypothetical protein [Kangiella sp.]
MKNPALMLFLILFACFAYGCKSNACYPVFEKEYCIGSDFIESDLTRFNFIKLIGNGEYRFHEIWIPRGDDSLPPITEFLDSDNELIFKKVKSYAESRYTVDVYTTLEGKGPKGFYLIYISTASKARGVAFVGAEQSKVNQLLANWLTYKPSH